MKFEIIFAIAFANYLLNTIGKVFKHDMYRSAAAILS